MVLKKPNSTNFSSLGTPVEAATSTAIRTSAAELCRGNPAAEEVKPEVAAAAESIPEEAAKSIPEEAERTPVAAENVPEVAASVPVEVEASEPVAVERRLEEVESEPVAVERRSAEESEPVVEVIGLSDLKVVGNGSEHVVAQSWEAAAISTVLVTEMVGAESSEMVVVIAEMVYAPTSVEIS